MTNNNPSTFKKDDSQQTNRTEQSPVANKKNDQAGNPSSAERNDKK